VLDIGASIHYLGDLRAAGVGASLRSIIDGADSDGIFFGFDLDVVRSMEAPGVSDPGPMGLSAREVCEIADVAASDPRTRIIEITEVCPEFDRNRLTSKLAANIIVRALAKEIG
jgi:formiminoglutamase